jgi:NADH:ubiquinone oxidoreductase subunit F (NADH-binding)
MLATAYQADGTCRVIETEPGTPISTLLGSGAEVQAWLVGGYHGTWLPMPDAVGLTLDNRSLSRFGASAGAGVLAALPADRCGLTEAARVVGYLAAESAGQCGPCLNGLPRIAAAFTELSRPGPDRRCLADLERWSGLVAGRGACHHPDGTVRLVRSALGVFGDEIDRHLAGRCTAEPLACRGQGAGPGSAVAPFLPLPAGGAGLSGFSRPRREWR